MVFYRILIFIGSIGVGIAILRYTSQIVNMVGYSSWVERHFGPFGGTHLLWKLIGILVIILGVVISIRGW